jgi:sporulation protein YlmC with PRC-barrel domain
MADKDSYSDIVPDFLSAGTIKGDKIVNPAGDDLGKIENLMIDLEDGRIAYAVLSFDELLGMGNKLFVIPWHALSLRLHEHAFTLNLPKDVLQNAEGFDKDKWPLTREELSRTYTYYGYQPYWQTGAARQTGTSSELAGETELESIIRMGSKADTGNTDFLSADSIKNDTVVNRFGENVGKIEELMIDLEYGRIGYAVSQIVDSMVWATNYFVFLGKLSRWDLMSTLSPLILK